MMDLKSGDPGFKPFCFLDLFSVVPSSTPRPAGLFKFPTGQPPPPIGILNSLCSISNIRLRMLDVMLRTSFRGVSGPSVGLLFWIYIKFFSPVGRILLRFCLRALLFVMVTAYEQRGLRTSLDNTGFPLVVMWNKYTHWVIRVGMAGRGLEYLSFCDFC